MSYTHNGTQSAHDEIRELQEKVVEGRREFFKQAGQGAVATAMATTAMHLGVREYMKPVVENASASANPNGGWKNLFSLKPNYLYMNIGTTGSTPTQVIDEYESWFMQNAWQCKAYQSTKDYCIDVASAFGANPSEFIMSFTTTDGMAKTLQGIKWANDDEPADNVLTTNMEHSGGLGPLYCQVNRHNVNQPKYETKWVNRVTGADVAGSDPFTQPVAKAIPAVMPGEMILTPTGIRENTSQTTGFPLPNQITGTPDAYLFNTMIKPALDRALAKVGTAKMLMFSSPPYLTGVRYPEKEMCQWAASKGIISSIDGAHLTGMINVNFHDMGVDLFAGSGHKWQCGPGQTGIAYIRNGATVADQSWSFTNNAGVAISGTASAYTNRTRLPLYWAQNDTFRMSKWVDYNNSVLRPMVNGMRRPEDNVGQLVQSIGNNSIQMNRGLYETMALWNKIGRANIDNYVVTLAQWLRFQVATANWANGITAGNDNAIYALNAEFRKRNVAPSSLAWDDVYKASDANFPVYARCGLTGWNPMYFNGNDGIGRPDYNFPLTNGDKSTMSSRSSSIITYLNNRHGIYMRNTDCPTMLRFPTPAAGINNTTVYAANATAQMAVTNSSHPFRISTHLFHDIDDVNTFTNAFATDPDLAPMFNLNATRDS